MYGFKRLILVEFMPYCIKKLRISIKMAVNVLRFYVLYFLRKLQVKKVANYKGHLYHN